MAVDGRVMTVSAPSANRDMASKAMVVRALQEMTFQASSTARRARFPASVTQCLRVNSPGRAPQPLIWLAFSLAFLLKNRYSPCSISRVPSQS